jgi:16S rRNA (guanine527-N7)-methyltransferase
MGKEEDCMIGTLLEEGLNKLGLLQDRTLSFLTLYIKEIELFNPAYGLVKVRDRRELIVKHIFDSLAPLNIIRGHLESFIGSGAGLQGKPAAWRIADVGSGAGFPGIPLAICMADAEFSLIERMGRRAGFLRDAVAVLGLPNVTVEETEIEKLAVSAANSFDLIVFRAWKPLTPSIFIRLSRLLAPGGFLAAYRGRRQFIEKEMTFLLDAAEEKSFSPSVGRWEALPLEVPFLDEERHLLLIDRSK